MNLLSSWSGGKDSCYALMKMVNQGHQPKVILNMMNENGKISRSHGIPQSVLQAQANALNLPLVTCASSWSDYEANFINKLNYCKDTFQVDTAVFGDIDLQAHRDWEEKVCKAAGLTPQLPLWQQDRKALVYEMIDAGIKTIVVSCNTDLGENFLGQQVTPELVEAFEKHGVDCCGENGEYHTLVVDCPLFDSPIELPEYTKTTHNNYCFINWTNA